MKREGKQLFFRQRRRGFAALQTANGCPERWRQISRGRHAGHACSILWTAVQRKPAVLGV